MAITGPFYRQDMWFSFVTNDALRFVLRFEPAIFSNNLASKQAR